MLLIGISYVILDKLVNKTLRTVFSPFYLSSLLSLLEEQLYIAGISYQLCHFARRMTMTVTTTVITMVVKHQEENLSTL